MSYQGLLALMLAALFIGWSSMAPSVSAPVEGLKNNVHVRLVAAKVAQTRDQPLIIKCETMEKDRMD